MRPRSGSVDLAKLMWLLLAASVAIGGPVAAQVVPEAAADPLPPAPVVEGATPDRVAQIEQCQGHKFDTMVQVDPVRKRSTRVKLCANPGASDADWVGTLEAAIIQLEERDMPADAKDKVIAELRQEIAKFAAVAKPATRVQAAPSFIGNLGNVGSLIAPTERYETSIVPPLPAPLPRKTASVTTAGAASAVTKVPTPAMRFRIKCLARGESGAGATCDYFDSGTMLALSAVEGMEKGSTLRFRRRGEARGEVALAPLAVGKSVRIRLPADLCRGVSFAKIELELLAPGSASAVAARAGPYDMRC